MVLKNKDVLIVGGSSGIGLAVAEAVVLKGGHVVIASRDKEKLQKAADHLSHGARFLVADITNENSVQDMADYVASVDHLVITASSGVCGPFKTLTIDDAKAAFESKFWGQYRVAKAVTVRENGSITFTSGTFSQRPSPGYAQLAAINGAVEALGRALAVELAPIRVNVVCPGLVDTPAYAKMPDAARNAMFESVRQMLPVKRIAKPEDVANAVVMMMGNPHMSGAKITVDGGGVLT